jgi:hypothetical protein
MTEYILSPKRRNQQQVSFGLGRQTRERRKPTVNVKQNRARILIFDALPNQTGIPFGFGQRSLVIKVCKIVTSETVCG